MQAIIQQPSNTCQQVQTTFNKGFFTMDDMNLGKRIESRLHELGWERAELLRRVPALTPQSLSALITRDSRRSEHDVAIAQALGVNLAWLNAGVGEKLIARMDQAENEDTINVPLSSLIRDPHLACILPVHRGMSLHRTWLNVVFPELADNTDLAVMPVSGYAMAPTFGAGDLLLVDQAVRRIGEDGIYLVSINAARATSKRLQMQADGSVRVISDNPQYEPLVVLPENLDKLQILGRVLYAWSGKRL